MVISVGAVHAYARPIKTLTVALKGQFTIVILTIQIILGRIQFDEVSWPMTLSPPNNNVNFPNSLYKPPKP